MLKQKIAPNNINKVSGRGFPETKESQVSFIKNIVSAPSPTREYIYFTLFSSQEKKEAADFKPAVLFNGNYLGKLPWETTMGNYHGKLPWETTDVKYGSVL